MTHATVLKDTTRGTTSRPVRAGTTVVIFATRQDEDGLKLLVGVGKGTGSRFQIRADETDYKA